MIRDFKRISYAVKLQEDGDSIFKIGIFVFYTVFLGKKTDLTKQNNSINNQYFNLEKKLKHYKGNAKLDKGSYKTPTPYSHEKRTVWGEGCFILSPH